VVCGEVETIEERCTVWRRVQGDHVWWDSNARTWRVRWRAPSNALQFDDDGLSTMWSEHLVDEHALGPDVILDDAGRYTLVYALAVADAHALGLTVTHTPDGATAPPDCAHVSVELPAEPSGATKKELKSWRAEVRDGLEMVMTLVFGQPSIPVPE
jgi:hypothetical protein